MEEQRHGFVIICSTIVFLGLVAFSTCIAAEVKRTKVRDIKLDGKLCYLPASPAFGLGLAALVCLLVVQIAGNTAIGMQFCSREKKTGFKPRKPKIAIALLVLSWISFILAMILLGGATSISQRQPYGEGWLDGDCYVVRAGVYAGSAVLVLATVIFSLGSILTTRTRDWRKQVEQGKKIHAQMG
ncbi:PREDICTED: uncharacterized protein LOC104610301 [Nelumbo nucifera]|uniref:Uncharacterized protein LOC104610301 n=2 Tax=Nelumbo nucifera TaxID=4432 RepID=A0A1U8B304_NELNU|nr:PREDICTED: uncharacterized protein LOC104610301 [Nelumbo nucifera]DAD25033.1 TPA_asm: hypothetical protein HUJ06_026497 [Nelumbo nucifera]